MLPDYRTFRSVAIRRERAVLPSLFTYIAAVALLMLTVCADPCDCFAGTYVPIDDVIYEQLRYLEAEGVINSALLTTGPLTTEEAVRLLCEAEKNSGGKTEFIKTMIESLRERLRDDLKVGSFVKPLNSLHAKHVYADSDIKSLYYNNDGDLYDKGSNESVSLTSRAELGSLSFYIEPEFRLSDMDAAVAVKRGYGVLSFLGLDLTVGKDSQWWGPGYHGAILLSNNAEPFALVRLTNPQPVLLPWILENLGPFRFDFYATQLDEHRAGPSEPYLWGLRLNFKPHPYIEVGLSRTAILGGSGRSASFSTWLKSFTGAGENINGEEAGDQKAGFDIKVNLPFEVQPVQCYIEMEGEDQAGFLPYKWAYIAGAYLPRILSMERVGLRFEYANDHVAGDSNVWYTHHLYKTYTYNGQVIGHHMGTDSRDIFAELSYFVPERDGRISLAYDREEHNLSNSIGEKKDELSLDLKIKILKKIDFEACYRYGRFRNFKNISGNDRDAHVVAADIEYRF
ncbi:MAG: capsule assembly Wzi family protein [Nitrospirales bacterium]|nr:capsule assembly Wzi family protein [Nitrospirales bacterium]